MPIAGPIVMSELMHQSMMQPKEQDSQPSDWDASDNGSEMSLNSEGTSTSKMQLSPSKKFNSLVDKNKV